MLEDMISLGIGPGRKVVMEDHNQESKGDFQDNVLGQDLDWEALRDVNHRIEGIEVVSQVRITRGSLIDILHVSARIVRSY